MIVDHLPAITHDQACNVRLTHHARMAMQRRDVTMRQVYDALTDPHIVDVSVHTGRRRYFRDAFGFVCAMEHPPNLEPRVVLITVILRSPGDWTDEHARQRQIQPYVPADSQGPTP